MIKIENFKATKTFYVLTPKSHLIRVKNFFLCLQWKEASGIGNGNTFCDYFGDLLSLWYLCAFFSINYDCVCFVWLGYG